MKMSQFGNRENNSQVPYRFKKLKLSQEFMFSKLRNPLYRNSIFLMLSSTVGAGTGFIFWIIAARLYSTEDVGLSSAIVSVMRLLMLLSFVGLNIGFIRYLPEKENKKDCKHIVNNCGNAILRTVSRLLPFRWLYSAISEDNSDIHSGICVVCANSGTIELYGTEHLRSF